MASYTVLDAPTVGLSQGFGRGMDSVNKMLNVYAQAMMEDKFRSGQKDKERIRQESINEAFRKKYSSDPAFELSETVSPSGTTLSAKKKLSSVEPTRALKHIAAGIASPQEMSAIGGLKGVSAPTEIPGMSMADGSVGMIPATGNLQNEAFQEALQKTLFPQYTPQEMTADAVGLPKKVASSELPQDYIEEVKAISQLPSETDIKDGLVGLLSKYADNPEVVKHLSSFLTARNKAVGRSSSSKRPIREFKNK